MMVHNGGGGGSNSTAARKKRDGGLVILYCEWKTALFEMLCYCVVGVLMQFCEELRFYIHR